MEPQGESLKSTIYIVKVNLEAGNTGQRKSWVKSLPFPPPYPQAKQILFRNN